MTLGVLEQLYVRAEGSRGERASAGRWVGRVDLSKAAKADLSSDLYVSLPQDVHTASWQTPGVGSAVPVQRSAPTRFKENMKNKQKQACHCGSHA